MPAGWGSLLGEVTALAMVVALSPFSVLPAIALVVHSDRPRRTGVAFTCGWLAGKAAITLLFVQIPRLLHGLQGTPPHRTAWMRVAAGGSVHRRRHLVLLEAPARTRDLRRGPQRLDLVKRITPAGAAAAGALLTVVNPKVVLNCAAAGFAIGTAGLSTLGTTAAATYFTLLAGSTAAVPILAYLVWSHRVDRMLERLRDWMRRRQLAITVVVLPMLGVALLFNGIRAL
jgi:Sap, sulfolipid-1-addressing protein